MFKVFLLIFSPFLFAEQVKSTEYLKIKRPKKTTLIKSRKNKIIGLQNNRRSKSGFDLLHRRWAQYLSYVSYSSLNGVGVKLNKAKKHENLLNEYLDSIKTIKKDEFNSWSENDRKSFLINFYFAKRLSLILSTNNKNNLIEKQRVKLFNQEIRLSMFYKKFLSSFNDVRIKTVTTCPKPGCLLTKNSAFHAANIEHILSTR